MIKFIYCKPRISVFHVVKKLTKTTTINPEFLCFCFFFFKSEHSNWIDITEISAWLWKASHLSPVTFVEEKKTKTKTRNVSQEQCRQVLLAVVHVLKIVFYFLTHSCFGSLITLFWNSHSACNYLCRVKRQKRKSVQSLKKCHQAVLATVHQLQLENFTYF